MNQLPIRPISQEEQQKLIHQIYLLMGKQVQSFNQYHRIGSRSSVPVELAQELMESLEYTVFLAGGPYSGGSMEEALRIGQKILEEKLAKAKSLLELVCATAPRWQTACRWEALEYLRKYLIHYDFLHLAQKGPDGLFYPVLIAQPEGIRGIDVCLFYLNIMWMENQIMAGVREDALEEFWNRLPAATLNPCEQLLINGIGKAMLKSGIDTLLFEPEEHMQILSVMMMVTEKTLKDASRLLCCWLGLKDEKTGMYVENILPQFMLWKKDCRYLDNLFL